MRTRALCLTLALCLTSHSVFGQSAPAAAQEQAPAPPHAPASAHAHAPAPTAAVGASPAPAPAPTAAVGPTPAQRAQTAAKSRAQTGHVVTQESQANSAANSYTARSVEIVPPYAGKQAWTHDGSWGWFLVASSLFVGAGLTGFGLGQTCDPPDGKHSACTRWTSMAIWGGVGVASVGSILGIIVAQRGHARVNKQNFATLKLGPLGEFELVPPLASGAAETR